MQALAIINLSTLDAYTNTFGEEKGAQLAYAIYDKISVFNGPIYIVDQHWLITEDSGPRRALIQSLQPLTLRKDIHNIDFLEDQYDWKYFLKEFRDRLKADGVTSIVLGGLWYDPESQAGAVGEARRFLMASMYSMIDKNIVALIPKGRPTEKRRN